MVGKVLEQRAAAPHVEDLQAAADAEHGDALVDGEVDEPELDPVTARLGRVQLGIGLGAVQAGLDIRAT